MIKLKRSKSNKISECIKQYTQISKCRASVGWNDSFNASKAFLQEMGGISSNGKGEVPPRPFIFPAVIEKSKEGVSTEFINNIKSGKLKKAFKEIGTELKQLIIKNIDELREPKLSKKTIRLRKKMGPSHYVAGLGKPLIETGEMRNSIEVDVFGGDE